MKRKGILFGLVLLILLLSISCSASTPVATLNGYHAEMNLGSVERALFYVAEDAVFKIDAAPLAGVNGLYVGRSEIGNWLTEVVNNNGSAKVYEMELVDNKLTCYLSYVDNISSGLGLHSIEMEEISVVQDGYIQSYSLTWLPSESTKFRNAMVVDYSILRTIDPADRKFYMPDYVAFDEESLPFLHDIEPADRKFFNEGYITNKP